MDILPDHRDSFFISQDRPDGVKLKIVWEDDKVCSELEFDNRFNGETDSVLNGILFGIMDVLMWFAILIGSGKLCVTRKVKVDFFNSVEPDKVYRATGRYVGTEGRDVRGIAYIKDREENLCAVVDAVFRENSEASLEKALKRFDFTGTSPKVKGLFHSLLAGKRDQPEKAEEEGEYYPYGPL